LFISTFKLSIFLFEISVSLLRYRHIYDKRKFLLSFLSVNYSLCVAYDSDLIYILPLKVMFYSLLIVWCTIFNSLYGIPIGIISNASLTMSYSNITINASNCDECVCLMVRSSTNLPILSLNCINNLNVDVICQFFANTTYANLNFSQIKINLNSTFYFLKLPLNDQSTMTLSSVLTTTTITTEQSTYF
jgi:hypothetical protein